MNKNHDLSIARKAKVLPITKIAEKIGLTKADIELFGDYSAKVKLEVLKKVAHKRLGKYVMVSAMTPTPLGEGKTVTTIGLAMALSRLGKKAFACIRQPSLGPVFGIKGGAAGGGYSQVLPMQDLNLHLTGDTHAVSSAHNLLSAFIDNSLFHGNLHKIDPLSISWRRVMDMNDRALRKIIVGLGGERDAVPRESGFDITAASEVMAILSLAKNITDLKKRLDSIVTSFSYHGKPITAKDFHISGAMAMLLKDAIKPNLLQTIENTPVFVHTGPFGNIAHGNSSIIADYLGLRLGDFVVTESGFGADCGAEKFFDIKCRYSKLKPSAVVLVCSIRALKYHSCQYEIKPGAKLPKELEKENVKAVAKGCENLRKHIENMKLFGVPCVVSLNRFFSDTEKEIQYVLKHAKTFGAKDAVVNNCWEQGGKGAEELASAVLSIASKKNDFKYLYPLTASIKDKIERIAKKLYGAKGVSYTLHSERKIKQYEKLGFDTLPVCMAKTHLSLSHDSHLKGCPSDFVLPVQDIQLAAGAGYLYPLCGEIRTMPGLPKKPAGIEMDIDANGKIKGLF